MLHPKNALFIVSLRHPSPLDPPCPYCQRSYQSIAKIHSRKEQELDRYRQPSVQPHHHQHQDPTNLRLRHTHHRPQIPRQEQRTNTEPDRHEKIIQPANRTPADQRHGDPNDIRVPVQRPTFHDADRALPLSYPRSRRRRGRKPLQRRPQPNRHEARIPIHQSRGPAQQLEVIYKRLVVVGGEELAYGPGKEEDEDDGGGDPERAVKIRVAIQDVEERFVGEGEKGGEAAVEDGGGVDGEELGIEGEGPEVAL